MDVEQYTQNISRLLFELFNPWSVTNSAKKHNSKGCSDFMCRSLTRYKCM